MVQLRRTRQRVLAELLNQASVLTAIALSIAVLLFCTARLAAHYGFSPRVGSTALAAVQGHPTVSRGPATVPLAPSTEVSPETDIVPAPIGSPLTTAELKSGVRVPILMYHYIRVASSKDRTGYALSVSPANFALQMGYLHEHDFHPVTMRQLDQALLEHQSLPTKPIVLTFDDGYRDFYTVAAPILREYGFIATAYIPTQLINTHGYMTWTQVSELDAAGFEMGAHTEFHVDLAVMTEQRAKLEINGSKAQLEQELGHPVVDFCYPYGTYTPNVMKWVREAGFWSATTTQPGKVHVPTRMFDVTRVRVNGGVTLTDFAGLAG
jgi:peptidoglycan/xylan/chitin deacetylase (PgdA/CDA1 family)